MMVNIIFAFDVDGTLIRNSQGPEERTHGELCDHDTPIWAIVTMLTILSESFKNIKIVVWSGGGKQYAETWGRRLGLDKYVWRYASKLEAPEIRKLGTVVAIDDIHACTLGDVNLIVHNKGEWHGKQPKTDSR